MKTKEQREKEILAYLKEPKKEKEIYRGLNFDNSLCSRLLYSLKEKGLINIECLCKKGLRGMNLISLTKKGEKFINLKKSVKKIKPNLMNEDFKLYYEEQSILKELRGEW